MNEPDSAATPHRLTLMTVHAHPDDEIIGTGGLMAKGVTAGHRVVLVTCTRGEMGDIVVPEMDTPENHRRLGEIRAGELEAAMAELGVTEWENLGYHDSDMMGRPGNLDPRSFWQADLDEAIGRLVWLVRRYRPDVMTTYNDFGGTDTRTISGPTSWPWEPMRARATLRRIRANSQATMVATARCSRRAASRPGRQRSCYEQESPASTRRRMGEIIAARGHRSP